MTDKELAIGMYESYVATKPYAQFQTFVESLKRDVNKPLIESIQQGIDVILESLRTDYADTISYYSKYSPAQVKDAFNAGKTDLLKWWGATQLIYYVDKQGASKKLTDSQLHKLYEGLVDKWMRNREEKGPYYLTYNGTNSPVTFLSTFVNNYMGSELGESLGLRRIQNWVPGENYRVQIKDGELAQSSVTRPKIGVFTRTLPPNENIKKDEYNRITEIKDDGIPKELRNIPPEDLPEYWRLHSTITGSMARGPVSLNVNGGGNTKGDSTMDSKMDMIPSKDIRDRGQSNISNKILTFGMRMFKQSKPNLTKAEKDFLTDALNNVINESTEDMKTIAESYGLPYGKAVALWGNSKSGTGFKGFIYNNKDFIMKYMKELNANRKGANTEENVVDEDLNATDENGDSEEAPDDMDETPYDSENADSFGEMQFSGSGEDNTEEMKREGAYRFED